MASDLSSNVALAPGVITQSSVAVAMNSTAPDVVAAQGSGGWLGFFGWLIWLLLHVTSTILYWIIRIATISFPTILYTLFSTSWTVTMNATTLYVHVRLHHTPVPGF